MGGAKVDLTAFAHRSLGHENSLGHFRISVQAQQVTLSTFDHTGGSPDCGSPITSITGARPGLSSIKAGTLDDASWLKPTVEIWYGSAQPWVSLAGDRQKFAKTPS